MPKAPRAHKHTRPSEPVTREILKVILIKTSQLQETFRCFNEDDRNDRRSDIIAKFIAECDRVHGKFRENDKWSYKDFIEYNLDWVARRYRRDAGRAIENRPPEMVSLDAPIESEDGEATFHDFVADRRDRHDSAILQSDYKEVLSILRRRNPRYCSRCAATHLLRTAIAASTIHGANFDVCLTWPELCFDRRVFRSSVTPT